MNRILIRAEELQVGETCRFPAIDYRAQHIQKILRAVPGKSFAAGILNSSRVGQLCVQEIASDGSVSAQFTACQVGIEARLKLSLGLAVPRPPVLKRLLRDLASLRVEQITLIQADLCEGDYRKSHVWDGLEQQLILGAEQGRTNYLPKLVTRERWGIALHDFLAEVGDAQVRGDLLARNCLVLEEQGLRRVSPGNSSQGHYCMALGPERGWTAAERVAFRHSQFQELSLGEMTLRTEVATHLAVGFYLFENAEGMER